MFSQRFKIFLLCIILITAFAFMATFSNVLKMQTLPPFLDRTRAYANGFFDQQNYTQIRPLLKDINTTLLQQGLSVENANDSRTSDNSLQKMGLTIGGSKGLRKMSTELMTTELLKDMDLPDRH